MKKTITNRQVMLIVLVSIVTIKLLILPNLFFTKLGRDGYLGLFLMLLIDFISLLFFIYLLKNFPDYSFSEILECLFGKIGAKIILCFYFFYFFNRAWTTFQGNFVYLNENLYSSMNYYVFSLPMFITLIFCAMQGVKSFARLCEIFAPIIFFGFVIALVVGISRADFSNLLPIFNENKNILSILSLSHWFGDYSILILFIGRVKIDKNSFRNLLLWSVFIGLLLVLFYMAFYGTYSRNTICHTNAISDILQVLPSISDTGSFDWVLILIWDISLFLLLTLDTLCAIYCFKNILNLKKTLLVTFIIVGFIVLINYILNFNFLLLINLAQNYFSYFSFCIQTVLPIIIFLVSLFKRGKRNEIFIA